MFGLRPTFLQYGTAVSGYCFSTCQFGKARVNLIAAVDKPQVYPPVEPIVACPFHKKTFSLKSGECLSGDDFVIKTYPVKVERGEVFVGL